MTVQSFVSAVLGAFCDKRMKEKVTERYNSFPTQPKEGCENDSPSFLNCVIYHVSKAFMSSQ